MKIYKYGSYTYQSKDLGHVLLNMCTHINKKEPENPILNLTAPKVLTPVPQKKIRLYRCEVCSKIFDSQNNCLDHVQKHYNWSTAPIKKFRIVLRKKLMKTMQMWKTKWYTWT
ncbi:unnamed protein product [Macrosiphum euphorbiae]|uniref:C2H2-type domain-containing protein n=1 Tax=Macrosiphum euphorbiae TaxID=13131 RepID=A0AAV0YDV5_9HEMI|nr:unnamed protein product [Macrosiphum euphorbiae]